MSLNSAYPSNKSGRRFLCPKGKEYKKAIYLITKSEALKQSFKVEKGEAVCLFFHFGFHDFRTKDGRISKARPDGSNLFKLLEDAICDALGINDVMVLSGSWHVFPSEKDCIQVSIKKV